MNKQNKNDFFDILRKIDKNPRESQRVLAKELDISLGKLNYCLKALKEKGFIKIQNFKKNKNKLGYVYLLTPKGVTEKTILTFKFMERKLKEYDELKSEYEKIQRNKK
tara:strand:+ start:157 stop:480 length:324 start_codon:yes stop_codon:yes gene_type:complete